MSLSPQFSKKNGVALDSVDNLTGLDNFAVLFSNGVYPEMGFTIKIDTSLGDASNLFSFQPSSIGVFTIYWGDQTANQVSQSGITHTYNTGGQYEIACRGNFGSFRQVSSNTSNKKLIDVIQWTANGLIDNANIFSNCDNLVDFSATDAPADVTAGQQASFVRAFDNCDIWNGDLSGWDMSAATTFQEFFRRCPAFNNNSISNWDVSNVNRMSQMFLNGNFDGDLSNWNTSSLTNPRNMFEGGTSNPTGLNNWDTSKVTSFNSMFKSNSGFNQDITSWDTSACTNFERMFSGASAFDGWDLSTKVINAGLPNEYVAWDVSAGTRFGSMFPGGANPSSLRNWRFNSASGNFIQAFVQSSTVFNPDVSEWELPAVPFALSNCFKFCRSFQGGDMRTRVVNAGTPDEYTAWDMSECTNLHEFVHTGGAAGAFIGDCSNWDTGNVLDMSLCFGRQPLFNADISGWDLTSCQNIASMFSNCSAFNQDITGWDTSTVTNFNSWMSNAHAFSYDVSVWDVTSATNMNSFCAAGMNFNYGAWTLSSLVSISGFSILSFANTANTMIGWANNPLTNTGVTALGIFTNSRQLSKTATVGVEGYDGQDAYNGWLTLIAPTPNANRTSGTNTSTATDKLIDSGATFTASVNVGDVVANTTSGTYSVVETVDSDTQLTLEDDIFTSTSQSYSVDGGFGWTLTGISFS